jgi:ribonuclease P protein component
LFASVGTASAAAWRPLAAVAFSQIVGQKGASAFLLKGACSVSAVQRLKRRPEFLRVAATRRKWVATGLILQIRPRPAGEADTDDARVGFTVSRKVGNAVLRNRARRRLKAVADKVMTEHAQGQVDFVIIGRKNTLTRPFSALMGDLTTALKKLDAYR